MALLSTQYMLLTLRYHTLLFYIVYDYVTEPLKEHGEKKILETFYVHT